MPNPLSTASLALPALHMARMMSTTAALEALRSDNSEPIATAALGKTSMEPTRWWYDIGISYRKL